jgi:kynurenine 3-monooxygenase
LQNRDKHVLILGAGLVGSLLAILLKKEGFKVSVLEKRADPRKAANQSGRSINLALSHRGIQALKSAGIDHLVEPRLIPMKGRMMHDHQGSLQEQPYGKSGQHINSVSRSDLNQLLISEAEKLQVEFQFGAKCDRVDPDQNIIYYQMENGQQAMQSDVIIGADGAFSILRRTMMFLGRFNYDQFYIDYGYKELHIPAIDQEYAYPPNFLHIWPRGNFMLIALPNPDKSFTSTLFMPYEGLHSFEALENRPATEFFQEFFPDTLNVLPNLEEQFEQNPTSSLVTIRCSPWNYKKNLLIGDASHAIVPFYGQGMNAGFEDCRILLEMGQKMNFDWENLFREFSTRRKSDANAIADMALDNFREMRDRVADQDFLIRKKVDARMHEHFQDQWIPKYSMVTFSDIPYSVAKQKGDLQEKALFEAQKEGFLDDLDKIMARFNVLTANDL